MSSFGRHLEFPFHVDGSTGRCAVASTPDEHIEQEVIQLLLTDIGERLFLPELGSNIRRMVFEGAEPASEGLTKATVSQALGRWLGERVVVEELTVVTEPGLVELALRYRRAGGADSRTVRFRSGAPG
jgi:phage baseplate assembly protein W